jgi:dTDP-4-amino-4,6-dideoxygalactose transaminase
MIPYSHQYIDEEDIKAVVEALRSDWITQGPKIAEFEKRVADYCNVKFAVAVSSGTAALHLACLAAGISNGDEVITSPITFVASANCVLYVGAKPVFADILPDTYCIDPASIAGKNRHARVPSSLWISQDILATWSKSMKLQGTRISL